MNKLIVFVFTVMTSLVSLAQDPVIMTINGKEITKSEFLQIYLKNNDDPKYDKASLDEYLELFKKFKLKVAEAEALGYDTIPRLITELSGYEDQLARPYLIDSSKNESLIQQAYARTTDEVRASHILVRVDQNSSPADTLKAYNRILSLKKRIENGEDFAAVARGKNGSEDPTAKDNAGDLGYFNAFQMVYPFEERAYTTKLGEVSAPFRTRFGYHILKVTGARKARGTVETAHLMISAPNNLGKDEIFAAKEKIEELHKLLVDGANWDKLVAQHSDDPSSSKKGGVLPIFGNGTSTRMVPEFTEAAFALQNDGDISEPVRTAYGFHIIKRIAASPVPSFDVLRKDIESKVSRDIRATKSQTSFVSNLKKEYKFKAKSKKRLKWFNENIDSTYHLGQFKASQLAKSKVLFKMDKQKFRSDAFAQYLEDNYRGAKKDQPEIVVAKEYKKWEQQAILDYEQSKLDEKYPAFKALMTEYHDGILLYEVMSDMVWNKAMKDTTGLKEFHSKNKANYVWAKRLDADVFECATMDIAKKTASLLAVDSLTTTTTVRMINETSALNTRHRRNKFDTEKAAFIKNAPKKLNVGVNDIYEYNGKFYLVNVLEVLPAGEKEFDEAKGAITSDYQNYLETEWLKELKTKHSIKVNTDVLYNLNK